MSRINEMLYSLDSLMIDDFDFYAFEADESKDSKDGFFSKVKERILNLGTRILQAIKNFITKLKSWLPWLKGKDEVIANAAAVKYVELAFKESKTTLAAIKKLKDMDNSEDYQKKIEEKLQNIGKKMNELYEKAQKGPKNIYGEKYGKWAIAQLQSMADEISKFLNDTERKPITANVSTAFSTVVQNINTAMALINQGMKVKEKKDAEKEPADASTDSWLDLF